MLPFIKWVADEISKVNDEMIAKYEPKEEARTNETELTTLTEDERKGYVIMAMEIDRIKGLADAHMLRHMFNNRNMQSSECDTFLKDISKIGSRISLLNGVLWHSVNERIVRLPKSIGIRKGWKAVEAVDRSDRDQFDLTINPTHKFPPHMYN